VPERVQELEGFEHESEQQKSKPCAAGRDSGIESNFSFKYGLLTSVSVHGAEAFIGLYSSHGCAIVAHQNQF
jgi:hypothetical protein